MANDQFTGVEWDAVLAEYTADQTEAGSNGHQALPQALPAASTLNDLGNAERLVQKFGKVIRYVPEARTWMHYNGTRWMKVSDAFMNGLAKQVLREMQEQGNVQPGDDEDERIRKAALVRWVQKCSFNNHTEIMVRQARDAVLAHPEDFDKDPWLVNAEDVTIDLRTREVHKHRAEDMITKVTGTTLQTNIEGTRFQKFMEEITGGDKELERYIQKVLGYSLSGVIREQHLFMPFGTGRNGKTVLFEIVSDVMGSYAEVGETSIIIDQGKFHPKNFGLANLVGARLVVFAEINNGERMNSKVVKELTGGDTTHAEAKFQQAYSFKPQFKMFLYLNHLPSVEEVGDALWERIRVIPFNECFIKGRPDCHEPDGDLLEKLQAEKAAILNWLVEGCRMWQEEGLDAPESVLNATKVYREESDVLAEFLAECTVREIGAKTKGPDLYNTYLDWFEGDMWEKLESVPFSKKLVAHGFQGKRSHGITTYSNIRLRDDIDFSKRKNKSPYSDDGVGSDDPDEDRD